MQKFPHKKVLGNNISRELKIATAPMIITAALQKCQWTKMARISGFPVTMAMPWLIPIYIEDIMHDGNDMSMPGCKSVTYRCS